MSFQILSPGGPFLSHHVGGVVEGGLLVHGGVAEVGSRTPLNHLHLFSFETQVWTNLTTTHSPALSYHACVVMAARWLVLIGGWNGSKRCSDVKVFDSSTRQWITCRTRGFPEGSGLSSHTATSLENHSILVVGREGFQKTQRRHSSVFLLTGNPATGAFRYKRLERVVESRSGHSCNLLGRCLVVLGGRSKQFCESQPFALRASISQSSCQNIEALRGKGNEEKEKADKKIRKKETLKKGENDDMVQRREIVVRGVGKEAPSARKYHGTVPLNDNRGLLVHGGWTFDGRSKDPSSEWYVLKLTTPKELKWIGLGDSRVKLAGHVVCSDGERVFVQGGEGEGGRIRCTLYEIQFK